MNDESISFLLQYHEEIRNIGLIAAALLGFPFLVWRTFIASKAAQISEANRISEMFAKSVELLGSNETSGVILEKRIGAIFALEQTANNNKDYFAQVIHILCSYVRLNSKIDCITSDDGVREDIQVAVTVIGRLKPTSRRIPKDIDLSFTNLSGIILNSSNFSRAKFIGCNLVNSVFESVDMRVCDLERANLTGAFIYNCDFERANFFEAVLNNSQVEGTSFHGANTESLSTKDATFVNVVIEPSNKSMLESQGV